METIVLLVLLAIIVYALVQNFTGRNNNQPQQYPSQRQTRYPSSQSERQRPQYDDPNIESRGGFGRNRPIESRKRSVGYEPRKTYDDPDIESRGGFGRDKD